jgi:hypothetical protein
MFIALVFILFVGHLYLRESFYGSPGSTVNVSISDLMAALGQTQGQKPIIVMNNLPTEKSGTITPSGSGNKDPTSVYLGMKNEILSEVKTALNNELSGSPLATAFGAASASTAQGNLYVQSIPGKSPADDYIRKDSIPCYACSLP